MYEPVAEEAGASLKLSAGEGDFKVHGHRQLCAQAVSNLIENAIKYGASGGRIDLGVSETNRRLTISVTDHGPGIPEAQRGEARLRFRRLDSSRSQEGAGLGLTLVESIAHLHGGELSLADAQPGLRAAIEIPSDQGVEPAA